MKKLLFIIFSLILSLSFIACSGDEEHAQNDGVVYYSAKTEVYTKAYSETVVTELYIVTTEQDVSTDELVYKNEPNDTEQVKEETVKIIKGSVVYITPSGIKYHFSKTCPGKNATPVTLEEAILSGRDACKKCTD